MNKKIASEIEFLRYFFDQVSISTEERAYLEEGFELCFNKVVPEHLKTEVNTSKIDLIHPITIKCDPPAQVLEEIMIPKSPRLPSLKELLLDKTENGDYVLMHRGSGEHVSLSLIIAQLKELNK